MTQSPRRSRFGRERIMAALNVPIKFILRLPFQTPLSRRLMLLSFTGRKTGRAYTIPVSYVQQGDTLLVPGGGAWERNLETGRSVRVMLRGVERAARVKVVKEANEVEQLVTEMMAANPALAGFIGVPRRSDGRPDRSRLGEALRAGFAVVRLRLEDGEGVKQQLPVQPEWGPVQEAPSVKELRR
jgi:deazaflavin-dependent oxidoreductase (nitroreductase family)